MKKILIFTLTAVCLLALALGLCSCGGNNNRSAEFVAMDGDKIVGTWIVGGKRDIASDRLDKIVTAYNSITELEKYEKVSEKDAIITIVIFSDYDDNRTNIFKIDYIGDNTFSIGISGSADAAYNVVSEELYRAITEKID